MDYDNFVSGKRRMEVSTGHQPGQLNEHLFDFQHAIVSWAVRRGRAAIFADTGLGKTLMQLSWADEVANHTSGIVLILAPLAVSEQTIEQGSTFGIDVHRVPNGGTPTGPGVWITNYERMDTIEFGELHGLVLDESSILKAHDGKTRARIITSAQGVPYRLSCTATPSPNTGISLARILMTHQKNSVDCLRNEMRPVQPPAGQACRNGWRPSHWAEVLGVDGRESAAQTCI